MKEEKSTTELAKEHFDFLIKVYGFVFDEKEVAFDNGRIRIRVKKVERIIPEITIWLKSEPEFTCIDLDWLLGEYIDYREIDKYLFEDRLKYEARLFREHADKLVYNLKPLLLTGLKRFFMNFAEANMMADKLTIDDFLLQMSVRDKRYYEYIKARDPNWDPRSSS